MRRKCRLIAIVGGSGAGKSWLATQLQATLGKEAATLSQDDFYRDLSHLSPARRERVNFDHPRALDWETLRTALAGCLQSRQVQTPRYDFSTHTRGKDLLWMRPRQVVLVEGLWLLRPPGLRRLFDLKIFVECPEIIRFDRRVQRDLAERGRTQQAVERMFYGRVRPMHERYVAPQKRWADLVLLSPPRDEDVALAARRITELFDLP